MLKVRGLTKRYGDAEVVRGLDLDVRRGECFGLLGPNGAGKTTTMKCMLGLLAPSSGRIAVFWLPPASAGARRRSLSRIIAQRVRTAGPQA